MTVLEHVGAATNRLVAVGLAPRVAAFDAEVLARHVLGWTHTTYLSSRREAPPEAFAHRYGAVLARRARREPVALITGHREFWGLSFEVTPDVLTPRPETELLMEEVLALAGDPATTRSHLIDVGTGSGCLAVALACHFPRARLTATDISGAALAVARRNAVRHGVEGRIKWVRTAFLDGVGATPDLIVANPPYIPASDLDDLPPEVRDHEPREALVGGADGLEAIAGLLVRAGDQLASGGHLVVEFGAGQAAAVRRLTAVYPKLELVRIRNDLQGIPRAGVIRRLPPGLATHA